MFLNEQNLLWTDYLNVEGSDRLLCELCLGSLGEPAADEGRGDAEEALDAGARERDQDERVLVFLLVDRAVGRLVDEAEPQQLDADDSRHQRHHGERHEAHDLWTQE